MYFEHTQSLSITLPKFLCVSLFIKLKIKSNSKLSEDFMIGETGPAAPETTSETRPSQI